MSKSPKYSNQIWYYKSVQEDHAFYSCRYAHTWYVVQKVHYGWYHNDKTGKEIKIPTLLRGFQEKFYKSINLSGVLIALERTPIFSHRGSGWATATAKGQKLEKKMLLSLCICLKTMN